MPEYGIQASAKKRIREKARELLAETVGKELRLNKRRARDKARRAERTA